MHTDPSHQHVSSPTPEPRFIAARLLHQLESAWNAADGSAFAAPFIDAGDFVDIRGELHHGKAAIAEGHGFLFDTIYKGSTARFEVLDARLIAPGCILFHSQGKLDVPSGPVKGMIALTETIVAVREGAPSAAAGESSWRLASFHNTVRS